MPWKNDISVYPKDTKPSGGHRVSCKCATCFKNSRLVRLEVEIREAMKLVDSDPAMLGRLMELYKEKIDLEGSSCSVVKPVVVKIIKGGGR